MGLKSVASAALMRLWFGGPSQEAKYGRPVAWDEEGNRVVAETIAAGTPCMASRLGSSELGVISYYLRWRRHGSIKPSYPAAVRRVICRNAGFFPAEDASIDELARLYMTSMRDADVMAVWFHRGEQRIIAECCPDARLIELRSLISMLFESPWSAELQGKTVLVVHPFAKSIETQYAHHRAQLFADPRVLPEFELKTLAPPQTIGERTEGFASWFDALDDTCERIGRESYDVALIGAGAYGLPIAAFVKGRGKQAVHLGGTTQLLFGIKGRRWEVESQDDIVPLFNEYWVRPSAEETPADANAVEDACYW